MENVNKMLSANELCPPPIIRLMYRPNYLNPLSPARFTVLACSHFFLSFLVLYQYSLKSVVLYCLCCTQNANKDSYK